MPGASPRLKLGDIDLDAVASSDFLHVGGPDVLKDFTRESLGKVLEVAKANDVIVTVDLLYAGEAATLDLLRPVLPLIDYFMPNAEQLCGMTDTSDLNAAVAVVRSISSSTVVVKMGAEGSMLAGDGPPVRIPALPITVVDTTGCGDAYTAGFIIALARGWDPPAAAWFGTATGALVASGLGSDAGIIDYPATAKFLASFGPAVDDSDLPMQTLLAKEPPVSTGRETDRG